MVPSGLRGIGAFPNGKDFLDCVAENTHDMTHDTITEDSLDVGEQQENRNQEVG